MSFELNEKLKQLVPYEPISGTYEIRLDANESFLPLDDIIRQELAQTMAHLPFHRYPDPSAAAVCEKFAAYYGIDPAFVTAGNGSDELISVIETCFLSERDKLLTILPDFSMYAFYAELLGAQVVKLQKGEDLTIDVDAVIKTARKENVSCIMFSNPCNPTGQGLKREEVRRLVKSVECLVVLDEAYMDFDTESLLNEVGEYDNLIILRTCSKAIGLAGIRLGFAVANAALTKVLRAAKSPYNVNSITQACGAVVLSHKTEEQTALRQILTSRDALYRGLNALQEEFHCFARVYPTVTNFVLVKTERASELFERLKEKSIIVRLMGDYLRITAGSKEENQAVLSALRQLLAR